MNQHPGTGEVFASGPLPPPTVSVGASQGIGTRVAATSISLPPTEEYPKYLYGDVWSYSITAGKIKRWNRVDFGAVQSDEPEEAPSALDSIAGKRRSMEHGVRATSLMTDSELRALDNVNRQPVSLSNGGWIRPDWLVIDYDPIPPDAGVPAHLAGTAQFFCYPSHGIQDPAADLTSSTACVGPVIMVQDRILVRRTNAKLSLQFQTIGDQDQASALTGFSTGRSVHELQASSIEGTRSEYLRDPETGFLQIWTKPGFPSNVRSTEARHFVPYTARVVSGASCAA